MNRSCLAFIFPFLLIPSLCAQFSVPVDTLYAFIRENSIHANRVDWQTVDVDFHKKLAKRITT